MRTLAAACAVLAFLGLGAGAAASQADEPATLGGAGLSAAALPPPEVKFLAPTNGSTVNGTVQVRVSANDSDGMGRMEISLDGYVEYANTSDLAVYVWSWDTMTTYNGQHELVASGLDKGGERNTTKISVTVNNTVSDVVRPSVAITAPANNSKVEGRVRISAMASDNAKLIQVTFSVDGAPQQRNLTSGGAVSYIWDTSDPANGTHELAAEAIDQAGNRNSSRVTVNLDNDRIKPSVSVLKPAANASVKSKVVVEALASDDRTIAKVDLYVDGNLSSSNSSGSGGIYGFLWDSTTVAAGPHLLTLTAVDGSGNSASASVPVTVEPQDKEGPKVAFVKPVTGTQLRRLAAVLVDASDVSGVAKVEFLVDGALKASDTSDPYEWSWDTRDSPNGARELKARATDTLGNAGESSVTVFLQNAKPPAFVSPVPDEKVWGFWKINGTAPGGTAAVEVSVDENPWQPAKLDASLTWEVGWNTSNISAGRHTLYARAYDGVDYSAETAVNVTVVRPVAVFTNLTDGQVLNGTVEIRGTAQYSDRVEVSINKGTLWNSTKGVDNWTIEWNTLTAPNGAYEVWARAWDGTNYSQIVSVRVTVSNPTAPVPGLPPEVGGVVALLALIAVVAALVMISRRKPALEEAVGAEEMAEKDTSSEARGNSVGISADAADSNARAPK